MIKQMLARQTQYKDVAIAFIDSQGGEKGWDFDELYEKQSDQGELFVICPHCHERHVFNWKAFDLAHMTRPEDFKVQNLGGVTAGFHWLYPDQRKNLKIEQYDEEFDERDVLKNTHFECFHCGGIWHDTPATREQLDISSFYVPYRPEALSYERGFNFPQWINRSIAWNELMLDKLRASKKSKDFGNFEDLKQWWQKVAARTWDPDIPSRSRMLAVTIGSYETDPSKHRFGADFHCRQMTVDCGKRIGAGKSENILGKFYFEAREFSKSGSSCQLSRGMVENWNLLRAQQVFWGIPNLRFGIDTAWMPSQTEAAAIEFFELFPPDAKMGQIPTTWRLMYGADTRRSQLNAKGLTYMRQPLPGMRTGIDKKTGKTWRMFLTKIVWSNYHYEQLLESILRDTVKAKWEILDRSKVVIVGLDGKPDEALTRKYLEEFEYETDSYHASWESQLNSRYLSEKTGKFEDSNKQSHPTEARDLALMQLCLAAMDNENLGSGF
jgi:hypothetical protein